MSSRTAWGWAGAYVRIVAPVWNRRSKLGENSRTISRACDRLAVTTSLRLTRQLRAATLRRTMRRGHDAPEEPLDDPIEDDIDERPGRPLADLSALPVIGFSRRRLAFLGAALVTAWIVVAFARQVGDAGAAGGRLETIETSNAELAGRVAALRHEYELIQRPEWIAQ